MVLYANRPQWRRHVRRHCFPVDVFPIFIGFRLTTMTSAPSFYACVCIREHRTMTVPSWSLRIREYAIPKYPPQDLNLRPAPYKGAALTG